MSTNDCRDIFIKSMFPPLMHELKSSKLKMFFKVIESVDTSVELMSLVSAVTTALFLFWAAQLST